MSIHMCLASKAAPPAVAVRHQDETEPEAAHGNGEED